MGVWIEMIGKRVFIFFNFVAPFVGVWIEISERMQKVQKDTSLPLWECGLKFNFCKKNELDIQSLFVGVWIEITARQNKKSKAWVAPFVGVWIEICICNFETI